ncbi:hypothetical protein GCM10023322_33340 [Rugosimonospora acidiphila]|uniref:Phospholipase C n=1 Tax=Rugosimonospora acidiphila TaxID=556531 RepID=A0ABP9RV79_9ACTN
MLAVSGLAGVTVALPGQSQAEALPDNSQNTTTPIKHVVVLYDENESFDHYFGTYPYAANSDGTPFTPAAGTPTDINTMLNAGLVPGDAPGAQVAAHNPNASLPTDSTFYTAPNPNTYQPDRLTSSQAITCDQNHSYGPEQQAMGTGGLDQFVQSTNSTCTTQGTFSSPGLVMDYYDGNTVTGLWNYAQNYAMSDNNWDTVFGPSTPGHLNLVSGNTYSGTAVVNSDADANGDTFGNAASVSTPSMHGANIGDLLNGKGVSWGWFQGGFASASETSQNVAGAAQEDYVAHHDPFQYYASTENWAHTPPAADSEIGHDGPANHQYDLSLFDDALNNVDGASLPAVSMLKPPAAENAHPGNSGPLDEQAFLTKEINDIEQSPYWSSTAIVVTYDDSDGWYDHVAPTITNSSSGAAGDTTICTRAAGDGVPMLDGYAGRCGPSQRLPLLVISPYAKKNYVSHVMTTQASVLRFIEDNWSTGRIDDSSAVKGSFDATANSLDDFFDWSHPQGNEVLLDSTMYKPGASCVGVTDFSTCINPTFGAVASKPVDASAPVAAPTITAARHTVTLRAEDPLPSEADFLGADGVDASITAGSLSVDLSSVKPDVVGTYSVTVTGALGANGDQSAPNSGVPAMNPQTITVQVAPFITLAHSTVTVTAGTAPSPTFLRSLAGATIVGGTLALPDLSGIDFTQAGSHEVQITGGGNGVPAIPATLTVIVTDAGPSAAPVITLAKPALSYPVGASPTAAQVATAAGAAITHGALDELDLSGVDFSKPGTYEVVVSGADGTQHAAPVTLSIAVVAIPVITVGQSAITSTAGTTLTSDQVLADTSASISSGALDPVDLTGVESSTPGTYTVQITGSDRGIAATPVTVTIQVLKQVAKPIASVTTLTLSQPSVTYPDSVTATVTVTAKKVTPSGKVGVYNGSTLLTSVKLAKGVATVALSLPAGSYTLHAAYLGSAAVTASTSKTVTLAVAKATSKTTLKVADTSLNTKQQPSLTIKVTASGTTPTGTVQIYDGAILEKTVTLANGKASVTLAPLAVGSHKLQAVYAGSATVQTSSSAIVKVTSAK